MKRISALWLAVVILAAMVVGCTELEPTDEGTTDISAISDEEIRIRQDRIRAFFEERLAQFNVVATTETESGQIIDWIRPESQTPDGFIAAPPDVGFDLEPGPDDAGVDLPETEAPPDAGEPAFTELQLQPAAAGPEGTVPIVRFDVEAYLESVEIPPEDPNDVLLKAPPPAPASNDRYYAYWQRNAKNYGTAGFVNVWDTTGPVGNETSIAQMAVIRGTPMQAIEVGKIENQSLNGNLQPHLFVYLRTNGSDQGDWKGGYNTLNKGWIQYGSKVTPGISIVNYSSVEGGSQYNFDIDVRYHDGNWWVKAFGEWAGYYPYCRGGDATPCDDGTLFRSSGLRDEADRLDWFGEIYDSSAPNATSTDMGSGDFAADGWGQAAWFRNLIYWWEPSVGWWWSGGSLVATDAACYSVSGPFYHSTDDNYHNWYYYGGPGKEASGCN